MTVFFLFIFGLFFGSFLNVLVDRLPRGENPFKGRSHCESCKKTLQWYDLIPLLSFISTFGRCRYCKTKLSWYYPTLELVTALIFVVIGVCLQSSNYGYGVLFYLLFIASCFIVLFFTDLKYGILPDVIVFPAIAVAFFPLIPTAQYLIPNVLSALGACLFFFLLFLGTKGRGMGFGDVKLAFLLGLILGFPKILIALYLAFISGALIGILLILYKKKKLKGTTIPFGPFLIGAAYITQLYSAQFLRLFAGIIRY